MPRKEVKVAERIRRRPRSGGTEGRHFSITLHVTEDERQRLDEAANAAGIGRATMIREALEHYLSRHRRRGSR